MSRLAPLEPPYPDWFNAAMARVMPPGAEPLSLFRTVATSQRAWDKFAGGSLLDKGPLALREREIVILRTTARCGCSYEWGVHVAVFAGRARLSEAEVAGSAARDVDPGLWSDAEAVLIATTDALIDRKRLSDMEYEALRTHFESEQILEIVQLIAFYHGVSLICGTIDLQPEPGTPVLPTGATA